MTSLHHWLCHITIILLCLAFNSAVQAQDRCTMPVYGVADIHLDENAATGTAAREQAIAAATAQAYQVILRRILLPGQPGEADIRALNGADFVDFIFFILSGERNSKLPAFSFCFLYSSLAVLFQLKLVSLVSMGELADIPIPIGPIVENIDELLYISFHCCFRELCYFIQLVDLGSDLGHCVSCW